MSRPRILVVDDSAEMRDLLVDTVLKPEGFDVLTAASGLEAIERVVAKPPDLIISDHAMPNMTGLEMLAAVRAQGFHDIPAILMTAEGSEEIAAKSFHVGVRYYFIKPFDPDELVKAIKLILPVQTAPKSKARAVWTENHAMALLAALDEAMVVIDDKGKVRYTNQAAEPFLAKSPAESAGKKLTAVFKDKHLADILLKAKEADATEALTDDGKAYQVAVQHVEDLGSVILFIDITASKAMDEQRSEFVSTVAHDLRSPLTGILGYLDFMTRVGKLTPQQEMFTTKMKAAVERMTQLLNDLLELSRIESGTETPREQISMWDLITSVTDGLKDIVETRKQKLVLNGKKKTKLLVEANPRRLHQVFSNLIENASKYTPNGGTITVKLESLEGQVMATITDTGIGIAPDEIPHVFDKFYRVGEVAAAYDGTGLGLSIVKSVIETYNGRVWVDSKLGKGSSFTIVLPAV